MLKIRKEQFDTLESHMRDKFANEMQLHLSSEFPDETAQMEPETLLGFIRRFVKDARANEIIYDPDIQGYLEVCLTNKQMHTNPRPQKVAEILKYPSRAGNRKIELLQNFFLAENIPKAIDV